jgi:type IV pilus assembly protein PilM
MSTQAIGLDITPTALIAVVLKKKGKLHVVDRVATRALSPGVVVDGEVSDVEALSAALRTMWDEEGLKSGTPVNLGIANQRSISRIVELPKIKKNDQLRDAIGFEVDEILPIPREEAVWDFHTIEEFDHPELGTRYQRHIVVMTYRESVERYRDAVDGAGLKLGNIDLAAFALMRAGLPSVRAYVHAELGGEPEQPLLVALCDVGPSTTNVVVSRGSVCEMNRVVAHGTRTFSHALVEHFGWTPEDADRVVREAGIMPLGGMETPGDPYADSRAVLQNVADHFAHELKSSLDYYHHNSSHSERIGRIVLSGEGALLRGIEERFAAVLELPVSIVDASSVVDATSLQNIGPSHAHMAVAIGLGLEDAA